MFLFTSRIMKMVAEAIYSFDVDKETLIEETEGVQRELGCGKIVIKTSFKKATTTKKAQISKKLRVAESQPPELPGESSANKGEQPFDINTMTEEEFAALPAATLKRMRGDIV